MCIPITQLTCQVCNCADLCTEVTLEEDAKEDAFDVLPFSAVSCEVHGSSDALTCHATCKSTQPAKTVNKPWQCMANSQVADIQVGIHVMLTWLDWWVWWLFNIMKDWLWLWIHGVWLMVMNECIAKKPSGLIGGETPTFINGLYKTTNCRSPIFNEPVYWGLIIETIFFLLRWWCWCCIIDDELWICFWRLITS